MVAMSEIKYTKPRYEHIRNIIVRIYQEFNINSYPVDVFKLFRKISNCRVVPYSKFMKKYNLTFMDVYMYLNTDEGCTIYEAKSQRYIVYYNDFKQLKSIERQRWTLAHELGHILLRHHVLSDRTKISRNTLTEDEYEWMEKEANYFASLLLAHPLILYKLKIKNETDIAKICGISNEAAIYRFEYYKKWYKHKRINVKEILIVLQFYDFIYKRYCPNCGHHCISNEFVYCPICGQKLQWGDGTMKYNDGYELDEKGKVLKCPICGNEEVGESEYEEYCIICGTYLINKCTSMNCERIVPGNARYCPYCGAITTFFSNKLLLPWKEAQKRILEAHEEIAWIKGANEEVAATIDEDELPF